MKKERLLLCLAVVAAAVCLDARAADIEFHRRAKTGGSWNDVNNWVTNQDGSVIRGTYPQDPATDRVWLHDGFTNETRELYLESDINVLNMMRLSAGSGNQTNYLNLGGHTLSVVNYLNQDWGSAGTFAITNGNISATMIRTMGSGYCLGSRGRTPGSISMALGGGSASDITVPDPHCGFPTGRSATGRATGFMWGGSRTEATTTVTD